MQKSLILVVLVSLLVSCVVADDTLELALVLFRHGDRTPLHYLPDPYNIFSKAPRQTGQLTTIGQKQHFDLGTKLRYKFVDQHSLLSSSFNNSQILVRSTGTDRTIMSAYSNLLGLYPPGTGNPDLPDQIQPVPIRSVSHTPWENLPDRLLRPFDLGTCPRITKLRSEIFASSAVKAYDKSQAGLYNTLKTKLGLGWTPSLEHIDEVYDPLMVMHFHNNPMPAGLTAAEYEAVDAVHQHLTHTQVGEYKSEISKLLGTNIGREWTSEIDAVMAGTPNATVVYYSAHDSTIEFTLRWLGVFPDTRVVPYASLLEVDLWKNDDGDYYLHFAFNNDTLSIPGCTGDKCTVAEWKALMDQITVKDWDSACGLVPAPTPAPVVKTVHSGIPPLVFVVVVVVMLVGMGVMCVAAFSAGVGMRVWKMKHDSDKKGVEEPLLADVVENDTLV
ncbi:Histidine phosphatase superfamily [Carpediemonas membranifera]|uniref:Histidine phosphatase superfamily n=1 Tax=Carpediemonas membranifera TaxID=201153 RepID=A0A8J6AX98_9EUKA|nr:Histidine phosphatase superfamily [Carpediemonas membranifera]|eukprot:KAG9396433.1 Histidine phosphatase superfamily [Carpediemonas membranifera]